MDNKYVKLEDVEDVITLMVVRNIFLEGSEKYKQCDQEYREALDKLRASAIEIDIDNNYSKEYWEALDILKQKVIEREKKMSSLPDVDYDINMLERNIELPVNKGEQSIKLNIIEYARLVQDVHNKLLQHEELEGTIVTLGHSIKYKLDISI